MTTDVSISNMAIAAVGGHAAITSMTEKSAEAKYCNIYYAPAVAAVLEDYDWGFARREVVLALSGTAPTRWVYSYAWPNNTVALREITQVDRQAKPIGFEVVTSVSMDKRFILTDEANACMWVTSTVTLPDMFSPLFVEALYFKLAALIAMPLTKKRTLRDDMIASYARALPAAASSDLNQKESLEPREADWISARG